MWLFGLNPVAIIFVTGNDTGVGKTHVCGILARHFARRGPTQVIKPVESGVSVGRPADAPKAAGRWAEAHTFISLPEALAPISAAARVGQKLSLKKLLSAYRKLKPAEYQVIEGAGGVAVPLDLQNHDWADFARAVKPDYVVVVVEDRLGAINQARLSVAHLAKKYRGRIGVWLNASARRPSATVAQTTRYGLRQAGIHLAGESAYQGSRGIFHQKFWA